MGQTPGVHKTPESYASNLSQLSKPSGIPVQGASAGV